MRSLLAWILLLCVPAAAQVHIVSARWGFNGRQVVGEFNLLTVTVRNDSKREFKGSVALRFGRHMGLGAARERPCYLSPGSTRTVRFYPFVLDTSDVWVVTAGRDSRQFAAWDDSSEQRTRVDPGGPATILLQPRDSLTTRSVGLPVFPDEDFPGTVAATGGLDRVVLDHVPRFQSVQETAFLDWLYGGGELHLMHGADGPLQLRGAMAFLTADARPESRVGAGRVVRHDRRLRAKDPLGQLARRRGDDADWSSNVTTTLDNLAEIVRAEHNWPGLYVILFAFCILAVPVHAWISFKKVNYVGSILVLLGIVAVGTWAIFEVGRRGHGETSAVYSISYAKQLTPGRFDVLQFKNLFSTTSARHNIRHQALGSLYSSGRADERVPGRLFQGADPRFAVHVPLFTSRAFLHRGVFQSKPVHATVTSGGGDLGRLHVAWTGPEAVAAMAFRGKRGVKLETAAPGGLLVTDGASKRVRSLINVERHYRYMSNRYQYGPNADADMIARRRFPRVVGDRWRVHAAQDVTARSGADTLRLVILTKGCPDEFRIRREGAAAEVGTEHGYVIYELTIPIGD